MKIILTGSTGQLGKTISLMKPKEITLIALSRKDLNLKDKEACFEIVKELKPDWIINSAAYTAVDLAEDNIEEAYAINFEAPKQFAKALKLLGGNLLQISTDFVFDGNTNIPYLPTNKRNPINIYGKSKAEGEKIIEEILNDTNQSTILRTSWLMSPYGKNFASTILNLLRSREEISIVNDQIGAPTSCNSLAKTCWSIINYKINFQNKEKLPGILHWSNLGKASWFDVANFILKVSKEYNLISNDPIIKPINSNEYKVKAIRPKYSVLDSSISAEILNIENISWEIAIREILYN